MCTLSPESIGTLLSLFRQVKKNFSTWWKSSERCSDCAQPYVTCILKSAMFQNKRIFFKNLNGLWRQCFMFLINKKLMFWSLIYSFNHSYTTTYPPQQPKQRKYTVVQCSYLKINIIREVALNFLNEKDIEDCEDQYFAARFISLD